MANLYVGKFSVGDQNKVETIALDGDNGNITLGGGGHDGDILMLNNAGNITVGINGGSGAVHLGGTGQDGDLLLRDSANQVTIRLDGATGDAFLGGNGKDGDLTLYNSAGATTIRLDGNTGTIFIKDWSLSVPDYVFAEGYELRDLDSLRSYIREHRHLPDVPAAGEITGQGLNLVQFCMKLLRKIEELALYALQQEEKLRGQEERLERIENTLGLQSGK